MSRISSSTKDITSKLYKCTDNGTMDDECKSSFSIQKNSSIASMVKIGIPPEHQEPPNNEFQIRNAVTASRVTVEGGSVQMYNSNSIMSIPISITGITNNSVLVYNSSTNTWEIGTGGGLTGSTGFFQYLECSTGFFQYLECSTGFFQSLECSTGFFQSLECSTGFFQSLECSTGFFQSLECSTGFFQSLECSTGYINSGIQINSGNGLAIDGQNSSVKLIRIPYLTGGYDLSIGRNAGKAGSDFNFGINTFVGENSGQNITSGVNNTCVGWQAGSNLTTGEGNIILGRSALQTGDSAQYSVAIGQESQQNALYPQHSISLGYQSMLGGSNASYEYNIALGTSSMRNITSGSNNVAVGYQTMNYITSGSSNIGLGTFANFSNSNGNSNIAIGNGANFQVNGSSKSVGVGNNTNYSLISTGGNTSIGHEAGIQNTGGRCVFLGYQAGYNELNADRLYIANSNTTSPLIFGNFSTGEATINNKLYCPSMSGATGFYSSGIQTTRIDIGTSPLQLTEYAGVVNGLNNALRVYRDGNWDAVINSGGVANLSDKRYKKQIEYLPNQLENINRLEPCKYNFKEMPDDTLKQYGFIAQEVQQIFPEVVSQIDNKLMINYQAFSVLSIQGIKELTNEVRELKSRIEKIENYINLV